MQALTNDNFMKKQLTVQLEKEFEGRLESKDKKIEELVQQVQKIGYEKNLDKEKYVFKVNAL